ncbi:MAG: citrate lyase ACP [Bacteroidetes bacterium]|nr:MAG: citrate lyase ACP [Bacteroidota bacterium]
MTQTTSTGNRGEKIRSDCHVDLEICQSGGIVIELKSKVEKLFGEQIRRDADAVLRALGVAHARISIHDTGALPFVLAARIEAAVKRLLPGLPCYLPELLPQNAYETQKEQFRFSRLYLPGNTPSMMLNAGIHQPNGIILDLEDSVAADKKDEARLLVRNALRAVDFYGAERMVRINQLPGGLDDLEDIVPHFVHLILIPKCEHAAQVQQVDQRIRQILKDEGQDREVFLMPIIESALGVEHAFEMASAAESVVALAIGLEDYTADMGVARTKGGEESLYARMRMVNACKAAGIQAIDSVFSDVADMDGLRENVRQSRALGFEGMGCIHPRQVPVIHEGFSPTPGELEKARKIMEAFADAKARGLGVISLGTKMIDPPVVKRAERTMALASELGLLEDINAKNHE